MDLFSFLKNVTAIEGLSGREAAVAAAIADAFSPYADEVRVSPVFNVAARMGAHAPRVLVAAHEDEIGMVVRKVEDDGSIRFLRSGGVDPRTLPASTVRVIAQSGDRFGVIGAKPPHLLKEGDRDKAVKLEDLYIDIGLSAEETKQVVRPGDAVVMLGETVKLRGNRYAGKTLDDRACVAAMLDAAERLSHLRAPCETVFMATAAEEIGSYGAMTGAHDVDPDVAIAVDVTHADMPGADKWRTFPLDKVVLGKGPFVSPALLALAEKVAKAHHIDYVIDVSGGDTYTDADETQIARLGVPTLLVELPLKYMHTSVELASGDAIAETGRFIACFIDELARGWEEMTWY